MTDSFVGTKRAFEGQPSTVNLREAEEDVPSDMPLELSVGFADEVQDALCVPLKRQRGSSILKKDNKKQKIEGSSSHLPPIESPPTRQESTAVAVPVARTRSQTKQITDTTADPEVSSKGKTSSRVTEPASSKGDSPPQKVRASVSVSHASGIPKSPFKKVVKRRILKYVIVQGQRAISPTPSSPKRSFVSPHHDSSVRPELAPQGNISNTSFSQELLEIKPLATCIDIPSSSEPVPVSVTATSQPSAAGADKMRIALVAAGLESPVFDETSKAGVAQEESSNANKEIIGALQDLDFENAKIGGDLEEIVQSFNKAQGEKQHLSTDKEAENSDVDITTVDEDLRMPTDAGILVDKSQEVVPPSTEEVRAEPVMAEVKETAVVSVVAGGQDRPVAGGSLIVSGDSEAGSSHIGSPVPASVIQRLREEIDADRLSTPYVPTTTGKSLFLL